MHRLGLFESSEQLLRAMRVVPVPTELGEDPTLPLEVTLPVCGSSFGICEVLQDYLAVHADP